MFLVNSRLGRFSAAHSHEHSFSRSYGVILQSSLAIVLSLTLGFSPHPCVSIFGTGYCMIITRSFSWKLASMTSVLALAFHPLHAFAFPISGFAWISATSLAPALPAAGSPSLLRHSFIHTVSTGISTCCPSTTPLGLALGPDLPRADQLYPGNLGYSAGRIPTFLSLLIPAFSLLNRPRLLPVPLRPVNNAPLPICIRRSLSFGSVFQPRTFSAQDLSTSELLRTL